MIPEYLVRFTSFVLIIFLSGKATAQDEKNFPVPITNSNQLFYLQRTPDINTVIYELNYKNGELNYREPVHVFWIRYGEKGQQAELSFIERSFAYGVKVKLLSKDNYEVYIVCYKKLLMYLQKAANNKFYISTIVNNKQMIVTRIFLKINGGTRWSPNIEYVEFKGVDFITGLEVTEQMKI